MLRPTCLAKAGDRTCLASELVQEPRGGKATKTLVKHFSRHWFALLKTPEQSCLAEDLVQALRGHALLVVVQVDVVGRPGTGAAVQRGVEQWIKKRSNTVSPQHLEGLMWRSSRLHKKQAP